MTGKLSSDIWQTLKAVSYVIGSHEFFDELHQERILKYSRDIATEMDLSEKETEQLDYAILLHDIGQIKVRETILNKPGKLSVEEFLEVQAHPIESEKIISMMPGLTLASQWVRWHHEWWDGSGYPDRLKGAAIPLPSRILSVADAFGAMLCERPYRPAMEPDEALSELLLMAGIQFDPKTVFVFKSIIEQEC